MLIDPSGDTLRAVDQVSAGRGMEAIQSSFGALSPVGSLFQYEEDGTTFKSISTEDQAKALKTLSDDEAVLFTAYADAINSKSVHTFEFVTREEGVSNYAKNNTLVKDFNDLLTATGGYTDNSWLNKGIDYGKSHTIIAYGENGILPGKVFAHELGHSIGLVQGRNQWDASVQFENAWLRTNGMGYNRAVHGVQHKSHSSSFTPYIPIWKILPRQ